MIFSPHPRLIPVPNIYGFVSMNVLSGKILLWIERRYSGYVECCQTITELEESPSIVWWFSISSPLKAMIKNFSGFSFIIQDLQLSFCYFNIVQHLNEKHTKFSHWPNVEAKFYINYSIVTWSLTPKKESLPTSFQLQVIVRCTLVGKCCIINQYLAITDFVEEVHNTHWNSEAVRMCVT